MLPILLILLGAGITAYSVSTKVKTRVDEFVRAIKGAEVAHKVADQNIGHANEATSAALLAAQQAASAVTDPWAQAPQGPALDPAKAQGAIDRVVDFLAEADDANRAAAGEIARAALNAETPEQRRSVAESASKVLQREQQIAEALKSLGVGECDLRTYERVTPQAKDALLARLNAEGMTVTGTNPYDIDTGEYGVKLRAVWDFRSNVLKLIVSARGTVLPFVPVPCSEIWKRIDPKMKEIVGSWRSWR